MRAQCGGECLGGMMHERVAVVRGNAGFVCHANNNTLYQGVCGMV